MHGLYLGNSNSYTRPLSVVELDISATWCRGRIYNTHLVFPYRNENRRRISNRVVCRRSKTEDSPYEVLGVSPSSTVDEIRKAYKKLALKYHPDVSREDNASERFMKIKHAYRTLSECKSTSASPSATMRAERGRAQKEEFYGFADFFRDMREEFKNWESSEGKPKSLLEELKEMGEEFVKLLLAKERKINDVEIESEEKSDAKDESDDVEASLQRMKEMQIDVGTHQ